MGAQFGPPTSDRELPEHASLPASGKPETKMGVEADRVAGPVDKEASPTVTVEVERTAYGEGEPPREGNKLLIEPATVANAGKTPVPTPATEAKAGKPPVPTLPPVATAEARKDAGARTAGEGTSGSETGDITGRNACTEDTPALSPSFTNSKKNTYRHRAQALKLGKQPLAQVLAGTQREHVVPHVPLHRRVQGDAQGLARGQRDRDSKRVILRLVSVNGGAPKVRVAEARLPLRLRVRQLPGACAPVHSSIHTRMGGTQ